VVFVAGVLALLVGAGASFRHAVGTRVDPGLVWLLLAPVGAAYVLARWYSFDPYFAPTLRRHSEGIVSGAWIVGLVVAALGSAILVRLFPRIGGIGTTVVLLLCTITVWAAGLGH